MARVGTYLFAVLVLCLSELVIVTVSYYRFRLYQLLPGSIGSTYPRLTKMRKERDKAQKDRGSMDIFHACVNFQTETSNLYILRDIHIHIHIEFEWYCVFVLRSLLVVVLVTSTTRVT